MSLAIAFVLAAAAPAPPAPPPGLQFGFWRIVAFEARAKQLGCPAGDLNGQFEAIRKKLVSRYGKKAFAKPKIPDGGHGDCFAAVSVYRANLGSFRREAEAALAGPASDPFKPTE
jgi:hypothetical protein